MSDIADVNCCPVYLLDRQVVQHLEAFGAAVKADIVLAVADFFGTRGQNNVLRVERIAHIGRREPFAIQLLGIDIDHDLGRFSSVWKRNLRALDGSELRGIKFKPRS